MERKHSSHRPLRRALRRRFGLALLCVGLFVAPWFAAGCNDYPLQKLVARSYTEITDVKSQGSANAVDILFVVDNSGSMQEEQEKLRRNFEAFITSLVDQEINDYQIGVITTDMADPSQQGRLQGTPKIINGQSMSKDNVINAFKQNIIVGTTGTSYEKALDAMQRALSPEMTGKGKPNEGFLRPNAVLAVIFIGDEDDCSNNGKIPENEVTSDVCRFPKSVILKDEQTGQPLIDSNGNPVRGHMEDLTATSKYVDFLKSLNRTVVVSGIIGNPAVYKDPDKKVLVDPKGGCQKDIECFVGSSEHRCVYTDPKTTKCGGCSVTENGTKFTVAPGFRLFDLIKEFGGQDQWFPICGDDKGFNDALLKFAGLIIQKIRFIILTRKPYNESLSVRIVDEKGADKFNVVEAKPTGTPCSAENDTQCAQGGKKYVCSQDNKCYGDGWVYFAPTANNPQARLRLSGTAQDALQPGYKVKVLYVAKNE